MKHIILIILVCVSTNIAKAQVQTIEDFRSVYMPEPELFLKDFIPPGFVQISHTQALGVIDSFFMEKMNKKTLPEFTKPYINYYKKGNIVITCNIYNDSLKWHIQQAIIPQVQQPMPGNDPYAPVQEQYTEKYWNPYHAFDGAYLVEAYLLDMYNYKDLDGTLLPGISTETRSTNTLEMAYAYPNSAQIQIKKPGSLLAFDKGYRNKILIRVYATEAHRIEAVNTLKWIAQHVELNENYMPMEF